MTAELSGSCMCGACKLTAVPTSAELHTCHCVMCRKWSGGVFLAVDCGESVRFESGAPVGAYKGSEYGARLFCQTCGSTLVWQMQDGTHQNVSAHAFDGGVDKFTLTSELFHDQKPEGYAFAGDTKKTSRADFEAMFDGSAEEKA